MDLRLHLAWESALVVVPGVNVLTKVTGGVTLAAALGIVVISGQVRRWHLLHLAALLVPVWIAGEFFVFQVGEKFPLRFWTYVQLVLVELGIVGLVLYLSMFVVVFLAVLNLPSLERRFALVLLITLGWPCCR